MMLCRIFCHVLVDSGPPSLDRLMGSVHQAFGCCNSAANGRAPQQPLWQAVVLVEVPDWHNAA